MNPVSWISRHLKTRKIHSPVPMDFHLQSLNVNFTNLTNLSLKGYLGFLSGILSI